MRIHHATASAALLLLSGCGFGLQPLGDPGGNDSGPPGDGGGFDADTDADTDTDVNSDTDTDTDTDGGGDGGDGGGDGGTGDTDTDTDTDADTDTDGGGDGGGDDGGSGPITVDGVDPDYGTTAGGLSVEITGGPFDSGTTVRFGGAAATVTSWDRNWVRVTTPTSSTEGWVDVSATTGGGESATLTSGFQYWEDGTGKIGTIGAVQWYDQVGTYWTGAPTDFGFADFTFVAPTDFSWADLYASGLDSCGLDYEWGGSVDVYEPGMTSVNLRLSTGGTLSFTWDGELFFSANGDGEITSGQYPAGGSYDLPTVSSSELPAISVTDFIDVPSNSWNVTSPNIGGSSPPNITRSPTIQWSGGSGDMVLIQLGMLNEAGTAYQETISCVARNDGSFTVPAYWTSWPARPRQIDVFVGQMKEPTSTLPHNGATSGIAGIAWKYGAGFSN